MSGIMAEVEEPLRPVVVDHTTGGSVVSPPVPALRNVGGAVDLGEKNRYLLECLFNSIGGNIPALHSLMEGTLVPYRKILKARMDAWWEGEGAFDEDGIDRLGYLQDNIDDIREHNGDDVPDSDKGLVSLLAAFAAPRCSGMIHGVWNRMPFSRDMKLVLSAVTRTLVVHMLDNLVRFGGENERKRQYWRLLEFVWDGTPAIFPESERGIFSCGQDAEVVS
jgi:hypothetical protein